MKLIDVAYFETYDRLKLLNGVS